MEKNMEHELETKVIILRQLMLEFDHIRRAFLSDMRARIRKTASVIQPPQGIRWTLPRCR